MVEEWKKRSIRGKEVERLIWLSGQKRLFKPMTDEEFHKQMENARAASQKPVDNPDKFLRRYIKEMYIENMQTFVWGNKSPDCHTIIYFHGGAYVYQPMMLHFKAVDNIARATNAKVYFPIYPKTPEYNFRDVFPLIDRLYAEVLKTTRPENITLMGDSAGGGIVLGFALWLKDFALPQPKNLILLSPWLDVTMSNKALEKYDKKDPLLSPWGLKKMGRLWADGSNNMILPYISPIYGDHSGLGKITIFVGTHEIFYPEMMRFHKILGKQKIDHNLIIAHKLNHVFPIVPIPEGRRSQKWIENIINDQPIECLFSQKSDVGL